jgi:AcrR family transcriptional regulator
MSIPRVRTRLSPEARKEQLLATARQMIVDDGLQHFTMEALARTAGVSSPLVYNYFSSRQALLEALLEFEYQAYSRSMASRIQAADNFEEVVRVFITSNFDHHTPGNILPILQSQPDIAAVIKSKQSRQQRQTATYLVENTARNYQMSKSEAELVVRMSSGASIAAASAGAKSAASREKTIDTVLAYVLAGINEIAKTDS